MKRLFLLLAFGCIGNLLADAQTAPAHPFSYHNYWIVTQGIINDTLPANFCLDTAAEGISLDSSFVRTHSLNKKELQTGFFGADTEKVKQLLAKQGMKLPDFGEGGVGNGKTQMKRAFEAIKYEAGNHPFTAPFYKVYRRLPAGEALLGINPSQQLTFEIYYPEKTFKLYPGTPQLTFDSSWTRLKMTRHAVKATVPLKIKIGKKSISGDFLLDTGSAHTLSLTAQTVHEKKLHELENIRTWKGSGLSGTSEGGVLTAEYVQIGKDRLPHVDIHLSYDQSGALAGSNYYIGIIGNKILEKYDVVIDYVNLYLYLRPNAQHDTPVAAE